MTYRPTPHSRKPVTRRHLRLTRILVSTLSGERTLIFHGPRGGKVVLGDPGTGSGEILRVEEGS